MSENEKEIQKTYANGYVGGPGQQASIQIDDRRTVKLYRADGGGFVIKGVTIGQEEQTLPLSDEAMFAVVSMYLNFTDERPVQIWAAEITESTTAPPEADQP